MGKIVLASSSPRRQFILKQNNYVFEIIPSPYVEDHSRTDFSYDFIESLAENKARAVLPLIHEPCKIIGADTIVVLNKKILGKPHTRETQLKCSNPSPVKLTPSLRLSQSSTANLKFVVKFPQQAT